MNTFIEDKKKDVKELQAWKKKIQQKKDLGKNPKNYPKTVEAVDNKLQKIQEQIKTKENEKKMKEDYAEVAMGTSKINYMDPRITISWCKAKEVPIEKVFPKTLRSKFAWAMDNDMEWNF